MSNYVQTQVDKIVNNKGVTLSRKFSHGWSLGYLATLKGVNLKVLDVKEQSSLSDYFLLASATNPTQAKSMANEIVEQFKRHGMSTVSKEGFSDMSDWILIDMGDILIHIFLESSRNVYDLDNLWREAKTLEIPQSYYFSSDEITSSPSDDNDYF